MAAALLGKCIGLLGLVALLYTCCYGFRIRDHGVQTVPSSSSSSVVEDAPQRATCTSIFGRCTEKTGTSATTTRKWHETAGPRAASSRKPPVEVTSPDDDDDDDDDGVGTEGAHTKHGYSTERVTATPTTKGSRIKSVEVDDDDDEDEAIVEVEDESDEEGVEVRDEQVSEDSGVNDDEEDEEDDKDGDDDDEEGDEDDDDEDEDEDEGGDDDDDEEEEEKEMVKKRLKFRRKSDEDDDESVDEKVGKKSLRKMTEETKSNLRKSDREESTKGVRSTIYSKNEDKDEDEDGEGEEEQLRKKLAVGKDTRKAVKSETSFKKQMKAQVQSTDDDDEDDDVEDGKDGGSDEDNEDDNEKDETDEKSEGDEGEEEDEDDEEDEEDEGDEDDEEDDEDDDEEDNESEDKVVSTPPPRKLEKVRLADKNKAKPNEMLSSTPIPEKPTESAKKPIETTKKPVETVKKLTETVKKPAEPAKKSAESVEKPIERAKKPTEPPKKSTEPSTKPIESVKKQDEKKSAEVTKKPVESAKKSPESKGKPAESTKNVETAKATKHEPEVSKSKAASKSEEKGKAAVKLETSKVPPKGTEPTRQSEKTKVKTVNVKSTEVRSDKKESKPKTKTSAGAPITLAELNDAILYAPTFMPNFTAVENLECQQHGKIFLRQLRGYKLWALQMLDSSAKIPSGLLRGNVNQLGDFDQCLGVMAHVKVDEKTIKVQGKYCLASIDLYASHPDMKLPVNLMQGRAFIRGSMRDPGHFVPKFTTVNWALCLPAACTAEDAENMLDRALSNYNATAGIRFTVDVDPNMCYVKQRARSYSKETIGVLYFYAMIVCLVIVATVRDYFVVSDGKGNYSERIIMSFSLRRTVKALLKEGSSETDITCIHGVRTLVTVALYIAHQLIPISRLPFTNRVYLTEIANHPLSSILRVSIVYTDAFLLLSGVLTAYNMTHESTTRGEIRWFCRFIARYIRLTPVLLVVVFWYAFIMEHVGSGPQWNSVIMANAELCKNNAWTNLLYIQNFFPFEEMCATHTHQLALDMQLSLLAPVLVFFLQCRPIIGILLIFFLLLLSATLRYVATMSNYLSVVIFHGMSLKHLYKTANLTYVLPLHRVTPYVLGVGLGVLLYYIGRNVRIHKVLVILGWLIAMALGSWSLFSPWHLARRDYVYDSEEATHYAVISPVLWALALCWLIFACFTNNGGVINKFLSNYWLVIFSRISYAVYLTQFAIFFYNVGTTRYSTEFQLHRAIDVLEAAAVIAVSIMLTLFFDLPMQEIKSVIMESTDNLTVEVSTEEKSSTEVKDTEQKISKEKEVQGKDFEDDEVASTGWDWQKDIVQGAVKSGNETVEDEEQIDVPILKKSDGRRKSFIGRETYEDDIIPTRDWMKGINKRMSKDDSVERDKRNRSIQRDYPNDSEEEEVIEFSRIQQEREESAKRNRRSLSRGLDNKRSSTRDSDIDEDHIRRKESEDDPRQYRRSESRGRSVIREPDDYRSWEFVGKERSSSRGPDGRRISSGKSEEYEFTPRQTRPTLSRSNEARRTLSSESEEEPASQRKKTLEKKHAPVEPKISDEEEWESELRIRRKQFMEKLTTQEGAPLDEEEVDVSSLKRRSSAEGRIALLKDSSGDDNMDSWTVSVGPRIAQLGSSQEPSEPEEDNAYARRREYREQAPPLRDDIQSEEEITWDSSRRRSYTSGSQITSEEEDETASYNFVLTKDSRRISLQDLSKMSQEETDLSDSGWNVVKKDGTGHTLGLYKRESIIKSQASEEDPEYLLPERPKLVQQEREHPLKKAWQMQKSRSEEDGSSAYAIKEQAREQKIDIEPIDKDSSSVKRELSREQSEDVGSFADDESESMTLSQSRGSDTDENRTSSKSGTEDTESVSTEYSKSTSVEDNKGNSKSEADEGSLTFNWPSEDEQFEVYKTNHRRMSEETEWDWEQEET